MVWLIRPSQYKALVGTGAQCTRVPAGCRGTEPIRISGVTGGCWELPVLEALVSLTGDKWEKHPIVTTQKPLVSLASLASGEGTSGTRRGTDGLLV